MKSAIKNVKAAILTGKIERAELCANLIDDLVRRLIAELATISLEEGDERFQYEPEKQSPLYQRASALYERWNNIFYGKNESITYALRLDLASLQHQVFVAYPPEQEAVDE